jgi:hypothetical protein
MFGLMAQVDPQKPCRACASQIPQGAKLCPVCKTYQERWKARIQFLSPATALLVATVSFALWGVSQLPTIRVMFWPREDIRLVAANSMHGGVVVNLSDEEIFVTHAALYMTGRTNWTGQVFPINELVGRAKFLRIQPPPAPGSITNGHWAKNVVQKDWDSFIDQALNDKRCFRIVLFVRDDPLFRNIISSASTVNTLAASGYVEYHSVRALEYRQAPVPAIGTVFVNDEISDCEAKVPKSPATQTR